MPYLQGGSAAAAGDVNANDNHIDWLSGEQNREIKMILANPPKWTVALGKITEIVFGKKLLAISCCCGRSHATHKPLDKTKLGVVRSMYIITIIIQFIHTLLCRADHRCVRVRQ